MSRGHLCSFVQRLFCGLVSVPDDQCSMPDLSLKGLQFRLGHLRVDKLHHRHLCHPCIALDLAVPLKQNQAHVPGPRFGSMSSKAHQTHIALSGPMTSIVKQGSILSWFPTFPFPNPHYNRPSGHWPCVKSCLVGDRDKYRLSNNT